MEFLTDRLSILTRYRLEVSTDLAIKEELFGSCMRESTRLEVEEIISTDPMDLARVSSFDIISGDLEDRESTHLRSLSNQYIGLVDTSVDLPVWLVDSRDSLDTKCRPIGRECEEEKICGHLISLDMRRDTSSVIPCDDHSCPMESHSTRHMDISSIAPIMEWDIRILDTHSTRDRDRRSFNNTPIENSTLLSDM
jgi:hypothetical protein